MFSVKKLAATLAMSAGLLGAFAATAVPAGAATAKPAAATCLGGSCGIGIGSCGIGIGIGSCGSCGIGTCLPPISTCSLGCGSGLLFPGFHPGFRFAGIGSPFFVGGTRFLRVRSPFAFGGAFIGVNPLTGSCFGLDRDDFPIATPF
jgi:hypothetical protein